MRCWGRYAKAVLMAFGFLALPAVYPSEVAAREIHYEEIQNIAPNGDVAVTMKFIPTMEMYQQIRSNIPNLYVLMRNFASVRSENEVVDQKADCNDATRTITFSFNMLGKARNLGNHWEVDVDPGYEFSNLDREQRIFYLNISKTFPLATIRGVTKIHVPEEAGNYRWNPDKRVVSYVLPYSKFSSYSGLILWGLALVLLAAGVVLTVLSFLVKTGPVQVSGPEPPKQITQ